jgi:uncharacterized membrane protein YhaH (DUF805 family)
VNYFIEGLKKYFVFTGRARRAEFWNYVLFATIGGIVWAGIFTMLKLPMIAGLYGLAILLPSLGMAVRRLHDTGRSGWWILINLVPAVGGIIAIVFYCQDSVPGSNQWGPNPKGAVAVATA